MGDTEKLVLTIKEASKVLSLSEGTLRQAVREGRIPSIRLSERRIAIPKAALLKTLEVVALNVPGQNV